MTSEDELADASELIDARIVELADWRGEILTRIRRLVRQAEAGVTEAWKWRGARLVPPRDDLHR